MAVVSSSEPRGIGVPLGAGLLILGGAVALLLTGWRYFAPLSGITGTPGALLAMFGSFMLIVAGVAFFMLGRGGWRILFLVLTWLGAILTFVAELFLHGWGSSIAMAVCILAVAIETFSTPTGRNTQ